MIAAANLTVSFLQIQNIGFPLIYSILWLPGNLVIGMTSVHEFEVHEDRGDHRDDMVAA